MQALSAWVRKGQQAQLQQLTRAFGAVAKDVVSSDANPFLRYSSPFPTNIDHSPLLSTLPETQVRGRVHA